MGFFTKKTDPISDRARVLNAEIASLEAQIKKLDTQLQRGNSHPPHRHASLPAGRYGHSTLASSAPTREPAFEPNDYQKSAASIESEIPAAHYNDLGVRKYDLPATWHRLLHYLRGPTPSNPKLISYLAAGSLKGLRPLRYEKRVARNRFMALLAILVVLVWGIAAVFFQH